MARLDELELDLARARDYSNSGGPRLESILKTPKFIKLLKRRIAERGLQARRLTPGTGICGDPGHTDVRGRSDVVCSTRMARADRRLASRDPEILQILHGPRKTCENALWLRYSPGSRDANFS
jgi:hypothetical protein